MIIWASPPCTPYSRAATLRNDDERQKQLKIGDKCVEACMCAIRIIVPLSMSLLQAGARSPRRRLLLSYREKNILYSFFPPTQRGNPRARRARSTRRGMRVERVPRTGSGSLARSFIRSIDRSCVRALTMRREYEHVLIPSEDGSARAGPATLLNDGETDATRTADRARIFRH